MTLFFSIVSLGFALTMIILMARTHRPAGGWRHAVVEYIEQLRKTREDRKKGIIRPPDPMLDAKPVDTPVADIFSLDDGSGDESAYQEVADVRDVIHELRIARENLHHGERTHHIRPSGSGHFSMPEDHGMKRASTESAASARPTEAIGPERAPRIAPPPKIPPTPKIKLSSEENVHPPKIPPGSDRPSTST